MKILVTGAGGFIGSHLCPVLDAAGHDVLRLDSEGGGVLNLPLLHNAMRGQDVAIHLAAMSSLAKCEANPGECARLNCGGLMNVLVEAELCGLHRVVFASSAAVCCEDSEDPALGPYARSKIFGEKWCRYFGEMGLPIVVLRLFNVYGPGGHGVINQFQHTAARGQSLPVCGDGMQTRDFVHVDDVVRAFVAALVAPVGTYDVGTGTAWSMLDLVDLLAAAPGYKRMPDGAVGARCSQANPEKFLPGWEPRIDLVHGSGFGVQGSEPCTVNRAPCTTREEVPA